MSDYVLIIFSIVWGIPLLLFVFYYVGERICRIDIEIRLKEKKKRTRFWLHKRRLYRKLRRFFWVCSDVRPTLVFLLPQEVEDSYRNYVFYRAERLEKVGYSVRIRQWKKREGDCFGRLALIYGMQPLGSEGL